MLMKFTFRFFEALEFLDQLSKFRALPSHLDKCPDYLNIHENGPAGL